MKDHSVATYCKKKIWTRLVKSDSVSWLSPFFMGGWSNDKSNHNNWFTYFLFPLYACLVVAKKADEKMRVLYKYKEKWESEDNI